MLLLRPSLILGVCVVVGTLASSIVSEEVYHIRVRTDGLQGGLCHLWDAENGVIRRDLTNCDKPILESFAYSSGESIDESLSQIIDSYACSKEDAAAQLAAYCTKYDHTESIQSVMREYGKRTMQDEVVAVVQSGPSANRIDVVFMGDGYQTDDREQHLEDMTRLINQMFVEETFASFLPLFNIWSVFRPSVERGIGVQNTPKNTAYRLYREGNTLRGIFCGNSAAARAACALTGPSGCDFPTLIGNDDFYGGLGGAFTISTRSEASGSIVLRHEMGHNFANVGEEYDGGQVYSGANSDSVGNINNIKWRHWLTDPSNTQIEHSNMLAQAYPWQDLAQGPFTLNFTAQGSSGGYSRWLLTFTVSGCETQNSFEALLDGQPIGWTTAGTVDRSFTVLRGSTPLTPGQHTLTFRQLTTPTSGTVRMICNLNMHEFGPEPRYHMDDRMYIGAYNTWDIRGRVTLRPQDEHCLMRNMTSEILCSACKEAIWLNFLRRMNLIDSVDTSSSGDDVSAALVVVPVAQFREGGVINNERLTVRWTRNNQAQPSLDDQYEWTLPRSQAAGSWRVTVLFETDEVRSDPQNILTFERTFSI